MDLGVSHANDLTAYILGLKYNKPMEDSYFTSGEFSAQLMRAGHSPIARLKQLSVLLSTWNQQRAESTGQASELAMSDINRLRECILNETSRIKLSNADIVADQILFLFIGAMKLQMQNQSATPWDLVDRSIRNFTMPKKSRSLPLLTLLFLTMLLAAMLPNSRTHHHDAPVFEVFSTERVRAVDESRNITVHNLLRLYTRMKDGYCQLPQAAMLQPQDRAAFIAFINAGEVDIGTAANLKNALTYVQCQYPQKLMDKPLDNSVVADGEYI